MSPIARPAPSAAALIRAGTPVPAAPWSRYVLAPEAWAALGDSLLADPLKLLTLWCDGASVHALFLESGSGGEDTPLIASVPVELNRYLALSPSRPQVSPCERIVRDLWGIEAMGALDVRPWLDHGVWGLTAPLSPRPGPASWPPEPPELLRTEREDADGAHQLGLGPVQPLGTGPAHLRLTLDGARIARLELRLGYAHRGIVRLVRGRSPTEAAPLVARIDAQASVAHQSAFARAVEAACRWPVTTRAETLRLVMGELEHVLLHLHHLGRSAAAVGLDASAELAARLGEAIRVGCDIAFGHRLMLDTIVPGGLARVPAEIGLGALLPALDRLQADLPALSRGLLGGRFGTGSRFAGRAILAPSLAARLLVGGPAGAASEHRLDAALPAPPSFQPAGAGDAAARCRVRLDAIGRSALLIRRNLLADPDGPVGGQLPPSIDPTAPAVEGVGVACSAQGPIWHWVRIEGGHVTALHAHDPSLPLWLALEQAAIGLEPDQLPLLCASLGLSASGADQ